MDREKVSITELIEESVQLLRGQAAEAGICVSIASEVAPTVLIDRMGIKQALINVISNAVKFTPAEVRTISSVLSGFGESMSKSAIPGSGSLRI